MQEKTPSLWHIFGVVVVVALSIQGTFGAIVILTLGLRDAGVFGDVFGVVNTLFSGLALAGVVVAIWLQKNELESQRQELKLTREEMVNQRQEMKEQTRLSRLQSFETSFYAMLRSHRESVGYYRYTRGGRELLGMDVFQRASEEICRTIDEARTRDQRMTKQDLLVLAYTTHCASPTVDLGPYCRGLTELFEFVVQEAPDLPKRYANLIRAQLSTAELCILFAYGQTEEGQSRARAVFQRFGCFAYWTPPAEMDGFQPLYDVGAFARHGQAA